MQNRGGDQAAAGGRGGLGNAALASAARKAPGFALLGEPGEAFDAVLELGLSLGGTITGEHGVGTVKADWLEREIGPVSLSVHQAIKHALDPAGPDIVDGPLLPGLYLPAVDGQFAGAQA